MSFYVDRNIFLCIVGLFLATLIFHMPFLALAEQQSVVGRGLATISTQNEITIFAEIADTPSARARGLMFRTNMATDHGMLFAFPKSGNWTFWMKNTKMPLDILWIDRNGKVVHIEQDVPICTRTDDGCPRYHSLSQSLYVLELKAGMAEQFGLQKDSQLSIKLP